MLSQTAFYLMNPGEAPVRLPLAAFLVYYALILFWLASGLTPELAVGEGVSLSLGPTARLAALAGLGAIGFGMVYTILQAHFLYD